MGLPVQYIHGMTSCSEWTGVPMSVLLREAGVKTTGTWLVNEGGDACNFSHTLPTAKALEDCIVAYGQNGDPLREEQGFPIRLVVPGWEAPFSVKYLKNIKVVDQPYHAWNEAMNHSVARPDLGSKSRWYHFAFGPKSVITRPSAGLEMRRGYNQITGLAWSGGGKITKVEIYDRRQELARSEASGPDPHEGAHALHLRLGVDRTRGDAVSRAPRTIRANFSRRSRRRASTMASRWMTGGRRKSPAPFTRIGSSRGR